MKVIVQCAGSFMLLDPITGNEIDYNRPCVVTRSEFVLSRMAVGQVRLVSAGIGEAATDAEFEKFLASSNGDIALAVSAFLSAFPEEVAALEIPETSASEGETPEDKKAAAKAAGKKEAKGGK